MPRFGLIGRNISYSFSRGYFTEKFSKSGLSDHRYDNFDLEDIARFPELIREYPDLKGLNVTIPYKEAILPYLDNLSPEARKIGAVNTICLHSGKRTGHNTDVTGFLGSLRPLLRPQDRNALILGTGGASKAVAHALTQLGIHFRYVSRNPQPGQLTYSDLDAGIIREVQLIINCTPLGTFPDVAQRPDIPYGALGPDHLLYDLIYNPDQTTFLGEGLQRGARIKNGLEMLQLQAEKAWELWNSTDPDTAS